MGLYAFNTFSNNVGPDDYYLEGYSTEIGVLPHRKEVELTRVIQDTTVKGGFRYDGQVSVYLNELVIRSLDDTDPEMSVHRMEFHRWGNRSYLYLPLTPRHFGTKHG